MIVYLHGSPDKLPVPEHTIIVCPAGHHPGQFQGKDWWEENGDRKLPVQFQIKFIHGEAEVSDEVGRYLTEHGLAQKSRLVLPNSWGR